MPHEARTRAAMLGIGIQSTQGGWIVSDTFPNGSYAECGF